MKILDIYKPGYQKIIIRAVGELHPEASPKHRILHVLEKFAELIECGLDTPCMHDDIRVWLAGMIYAVEQREEGLIPPGDQIC